MRSREGGKNNGHTQTGVEIVGTHESRNQVVPGGQAESSNSQKDEPLVFQDGN